MFFQSDFFLIAEKFKKQFTYLGENTEKYITFTVLKEEDYNN